MGCRRCAVACRRPPRTEPRGARHSLKRLMQGHLGCWGICGATSPAGSMPWVRRARHSLKRLMQSHLRCRGTCGARSTWNAMEALVDRQLKGWNAATRTSRSRDCEVGREFAQTRVTEPGQTSRMVAAVDSGRSSWGMRASDLRKRHVSREVLLQSFGNQVERLPPEVRVPALQAMLQDARAATNTTGESARSRDDKSGKLPELLEALQTADAALGA
jgi:hypothetical protein